MNRKEQDFNLLNGYLDRTLDDRESLDFALRLAEDPSLTEELEELQSVKQSLRLLQDTPAPRKYILTRAMAAEAKPPSLLERFFPTFRVSALVSGIALILMIIFPMASGLLDGGVNLSSDVAAPRTVSVAAPDEADYSLESIAAGALEGTVAKSIPVGGIEAMTAVGTRASSQGVRGGSPKMEILVFTDRKFPDDRTYLDDLAVEADVLEGAAAPGAKRSEKTSEELAALDALNGGERAESLLVSSESITPDWIMVHNTVQSVLMIVLAVSLVWIFMTLYKRYFPI